MGKRVIAQQSGISYANALKQVRLLKESSNVMQSSKKSKGS